MFHDVEGLKTLMGENDIFVAMLDSVFIMPPIFDESDYRNVIHEIRAMQIMNMGQYGHGNPPIQHMITCITMRTALENAVLGSSGNG